MQAKDSKRKTPLSFGALRLHVEAKLTPLLAGFSCRLHLNPNRVGSLFARKAQTTHAWRLARRPDFLGQVISIFPGIERFAVVGKIGTILLARWVYRDHPRPEHEVIEVRPSARITVEPLMAWRDMFGRRFNQIFRRVGVSTEPPKRK